MKSVLCLLVCLSIAIAGPLLQPLSAQPGILHERSLEVICADTPQIVVGYPSHLKTLKSDDYRRSIEVTVNVREWLKGQRESNETQVKFVTEVGRWDMQELNTWIEDQQEFLFFINDLRGQTHLQFFEMFKPLNAAAVTATFSQMFQQRQTTQRDLLRITREVLRANRFAVSDTDVEAPIVTLAVVPMQLLTVPLDSRFDDAIQEHLAEPSRTISAQFIDDLMKPEIVKLVDKHALAESLQRLIKEDEFKIHFAENDSDLQFYTCSPLVVSIVKAIKSLQVDVDGSLPDVTPVKLAKRESEFETIELLKQTYGCRVDYSYYSVGWGSSFFYPGYIVDQIPDEARLKAIYFTSRKLEEFGQLPDLSELAGVELVYLGFTQSAIDLSPLTDLKSLKHLNLQSTRADFDLTPIAKLPNLETLTLADSSTQDFRPLSTMHQLQKLIVDTDDLSPLAELTNLRELRVSHGELTDLSPLAKLTKLETLTLDNSRALKDLGPLSGLKNLKQLSFKNTQVVDLTPLAGLEQLQTLVLLRTQVHDLSPLRNLPNLRRLDLRGTRTLQDLTPLQHLPSLEELEIDHTSVTDFSPLGRIKTLRSIKADQVPANDVAGLADLENLEHLRLGDRTDLHGAQPLRFIDGLTTWLGGRDHPLQDGLKLHRKYLVDHASTVVSPALLKQLQQADMGLPATDPNYFNCETILRRVAAMQMVAVSRADLCVRLPTASASTEQVHELTRAENDFVRSLARDNPKQVVGCFAVDLSTGFALEETNRCLETGDFQFASVNVVGAGKEPIEFTKLAPILLACKTKSIPVLLHVRLSQVADSVNVASVFLDSLIQNLNGAECTVVFEDIHPVTLRNFFVAMKAKQPGKEIRVCVSGAWFDKSSEFAAQPNWEAWQPVADAMRDVGLDRFVLGSGFTHSFGWMFDRVLKQQLRLSFDEARTIRSQPFGVQ